MAPKIIIAGAPASGKGTQCEMIKERYGVVHLSTGDMLRQAAKEGTEVGLKVSGAEGGGGGGGLGGEEFYSCIPNDAEGALSLDSY